MTRLYFALLFLAGEAFAQAYPDRPVRIIVGYPPGGGTDLVAPSSLSDSVRMNTNNLLGLHS